MVIGTIRGEEFAPSKSAPWQMEWRRGEFYFRLNGQPRFLFGRNPAGWQVEQFEPLLKSAREAGAAVVRIHLSVGMPSRGPAGALDEAWAQRWDRVLDMAAKNNLSVLPVLAVWADWNDGRGGESWHAWDRNPFNSARGGPAKAPVELLQDTACRKLWLRWLNELVTRWAGRANILGWEIFSEMDLISGATEADAVDFAQRAAAVIRAADSRSRPVTASLSGVAVWPKLFESGAIDFLQAHPYADPPRYHGNLDALILDSVRELRRRFAKPVFIGECGLDSRGLRDSLLTAPNAPVGIRHALWAAAVSGAMNGRMLWFEDGYDRFHKLDLRARYESAESVVARFVRDVDFGSLKPLELADSSALRGGALGNARFALGWFRDAASEAPDWPLRRVEGASVALVMAASPSAWQVEFYDTETGKVIGRGQSRRQGNHVTVALPPFNGAVAFKMTAAE
ncbi:MAG: cellulase family glycosylhydrolase [Verrucomicrobia bacterium]|nr:cellulase family glycosylhydrolase [Verrucomicrobiota bacterium]